jgi:hypothetical protein
VTALVRDPGRIQPRSRLNVLAGDSRDGAAVERAVAGQDAVVCALGGRPWRRRERVCSTAMPHIIAAMQRQSVRRIVAVSTFGAGDTRPQVGLLTRLVVFGLILRSEVADKEAMEAQLAESDRLWTIVRVGSPFRGARTGRLPGPGRRNDPGHGDDLPGRRRPFHPLGAAGEPLGAQAPGAGVLARSVPPTTPAPSGGIVDAR